MQYFKRKTPQSALKAETNKRENELTSSSSNEDFGFVQLDEAKKANQSYAKIIEQRSTSQYSQINEVSQYSKYTTQDGATSCTKATEMSENLRQYTEEGFPVLQIMAFCSGVALIFSSTLSLQEIGMERLSLDKVMISFYSWVFGIFIMALEGKIFMFDVSSLHRMISNYLKVLRVLWGRGLFYIFIGSFHLCLNSPYSSVVGIILAVVGLVTFITGIIMSKKLYLLRSLSGKSCLNQQIYDFYDADRDGYLDLESFRDLIIGIGISVNDVDNEFIEIDIDKDGLIDFLQLQDWFDSVYNTKKVALDSMDSIWLY